MTIDEKIAVLQAQKAGKLIEFRNIGCGYAGWARHDHPHEFNFSYYDYRVKPEPREGWVRPCNIRRQPAGNAYEPEDYIHVREVL